MKSYEIVKNGCTAYHIVTSQTASSCERHAAAELQKYIYESTGVCVPYFSDRCPCRGAEIAVGIPPRDYPGVDVAELGEEGFVIRTDPEGNLFIQGGSPRGTLYGVYRFLEKFLGFRCFRRDIETIDTLDALILPETDIREKPAFEYREAYFRFAFDGEFCAKNRLNSNMAEISPEQGGHTKFFNFHHSFEDLVPTAIHFAEHPEYFSEIDGARRGKTQLCLSNPEVVRVATAEVFRWIRENPQCRVFSVAQNDNQAYCTCENCRVLAERDGAQSGPMIRFVNAIAREVAREYPHVLLHTFAYQYTRTAPKHVIPEPNVIVRLCNIECTRNKPFSLLAEDPTNPASEFVKNIREWSAICNRLYLWDYCINFNNYLQPFPDIYTLAENIRFYRDRGLRGVLEQGNFSYGGGAALDDLKSYVIAKLLWNPDEDISELIREFTDGVYGRAGEAMRAYIDTVSEAASGDIPMHIFDRPSAGYLTDELLDECARIFDRAEAAAENETVRERVRRERLSIEFTQAARLADDAERCAAVDALAEKLKHFRLTEIRERRPLEETLDSMRKCQYVTYVSPTTDHLYYIMR